MEFERWFNNKFPHWKGWKKMYPTSQYKQFYRECWKSAQKEILGVCYDGRCKKCQEKESAVFNRGVAEGRLELAEEILKQTKFWQQKVTAEKCLNDTIEQLGKELKKTPIPPAPKGAGILGD